MKKKLSVWSIRILTTLFLSISILVGLVLTPGILYAHKTEMGNFTIFHNQDLSPTMGVHLKEIRTILSESTIYDPEYTIRICLNDGSIYPTIHDKLNGPAFGFGLLNIAVLLGTADYEKNFIDIRGYRWNLDHLYVHELIHCYQQHSFGDFAIWKSNPVAGYPDWKWEGYAEYISRKKSHPDLTTNIRRIINSRDKDPESWSVEYEDGTMAPRNYYDYALLVQYCMEIKNMDFFQLLDVAQNENELRTEMMNWYEN